MLVYRQMRTLAGHRDADELAQIAAEHAIRGLSRFEGRSELATWTYRICYLTVRKHDRWYRRWLKRFAFTPEGALPECEADPIAGDQQLLACERGERLRAAVQRLSAKRRAVIVLHDLEGFDIEEIAAIVGAQPAAVRSRLRDARRALSELLTHDDYFGDEACRRRSPT